MDNNISCEEFKNIINTNLNAIKSYWEDSSGEEFKINHDLFFEYLKDNIKKENQATYNVKTLKKYFMPTGNYPISFLFEFSKIMKIDFYKLFEPSMDPKVDCSFKLNKRYSKFFQYDNNGNYYIYFFDLSHFKYIQPGILYFENTSLTPEGLPATLKIKTYDNKEKIYKGYLKINEGYCTGQINLYYEENKDDFISILFYDPQVQTKLYGILGFKLSLTSKGTKHPCLSKCIIVYKKIEFEENATQKWLKGLLKFDDRIATLTEKDFKTLIDSNEHFKKIAEKIYMEKESILRVDISCSLHNQFIKDNEKKYFYELLNLIKFHALSENALYIGEDENNMVYKSLNILIPDVSKDNK